MASERNRNRPALHAFTLIELSIVLVIIGLLAGGILTGLYLINAAAARAQIRQISEFNAASYAFQEKYGGLPGDLPIPDAQQYGFSVGTGCNGTVGRRDGNGLIDGFTAPYLMTQAGGETGMFWQDLSKSGLIGGQFPGPGAPLDCSGVEPVLTTTPGPNFIGNYFPTGKIGYETYVYVYENNSFNWFGLSAVTSVDSFGDMFSKADIPVIQAYNIDKKIDDGFPSSGMVQAVYLNNTTTVVRYPVNAATDSATTCYNSSTNTYSIAAAANVPNCALSFRFQ